jgi:cation diffusion facilitator CzcD-associated flavoprotein CzcO
MISPSIAIVGAGFGGLGTAIEFKRAGIENFTVFERASEVGGVWQANSYPGAACDVPSVIYQYSYALNGSWSRRYGRQDEIRDYLRDTSISFGVRDHIRFDTTVESATFDDASARWTLRLAGGEQAEFDVLICANGQLSRPKIPDVPGVDGFEGEQFHSAEWNHDVDLTGKRVAVVGGGATAIQVVPAIAEQAGHLTVVQRTPSWVVNKNDWDATWLEKLGPLQRIYHNVMWLWFESRYPGVLRASRPIRWLWEAQRRMTMRRILRDPQKVRAVTPDYQMGCNRLLLSRDWYPALARPDVSVIGAGVSEVTPTGVVSSDGDVVDADVIIWCTGFTATEYIAPMQVIGRGGVDLRMAWKDGPEAYLGMATPGFPNMFMVYGPNTNSLTNTIVYLLERQAAYLRQAVEYITGRPGAMEVRRDVHDEFNAELARRFRRTTFTTGCPGWYTTASGKVTAVWVGSHVEYGRRTRHFDASVYEHLPS